MYILIMPVKDEEKILSNVIESVINQTVKPDLWLIIDDGSTDNSPTIIQNFVSKYDLDKNYKFTTSPKRYNFSCLLRL